MRATARLNDLKSSDGKHKIVRNLSRILDIRILDIDMDNRTVSLVYDSKLAFEKVKIELRRIGFPIGECTYQPPNVKSISHDFDNNGMLI